MVKPADRRKKSKKRRTSSKLRTEYFKGNSSRQKCAITGEVLSGVPLAKKGKISKYSKTQRRPSVPFGGNLGSKAREEVFTEVGKVLNGKDINDVDHKYRTYVKQAMKRAE
jgi:ribosomal protein L34E